MPLSVFDLFSIGIGPSSSHTVGPMRAALTFAQGLADDGVLHGVARVRAELFGSLGATGHGHGSENAVVLGLLGERPETVDTAAGPVRVEDVRSSGVLPLLGKHDVTFGADDLVLHRRQSLPYHPNGMRFFALDAVGEIVRERTYYSVGGGFVVDEAAAGADRITPDSTVLPYPFLSGVELLQRCAESGLPISGIMLANEQSWRSADDVRDGLLQIWAVMTECVRNGWTNEGVLPGGLKVRRRAPELYQRLCSETFATDPLRVMDWVDLFALAVNEENAAGGRVVTAPTNGAAGVVPAVLHYYVRFCPGATDDGIVRFLLCAGAIGVLYKENASISGAEVGCQGEVGSACSMAAAALCEVMGGTPAQVENAAEIGME
ncbi:MAG: L-serine ammonia-lyase, partial [Actinomycetota bacterium]|nr:L-serine ammonia-lyase [Actinomycetota bacterium]